MMRALELGGMNILTDGVRLPDVYNKHGYFEHESVKKIAYQPDWICNPVGYAVKVVAPLITMLPPIYDYRVIFMLRNLRQVSISQQRMVRACGHNNEPSIENLVLVLRNVLNESISWLHHQSNAKFIFVEFDKMFSQPYMECCKIRDFLGVSLDIDMMVAAIDTSLHQIELDK